jgi:hypothetical protein
MEPVVSLLCSQEPVTGPCAEADEYSPYCHTLFFRFILVLSFHLCLLLPNTGVKLYFCILKSLYIETETGKMKESELNVRKHS